MRDVFAWALARVELGMEGAPLKASMPHINWRGAAVDDFAAFCSWLGAPPEEGDEWVVDLKSQGAPALAGENGAVLRAIAAQDADPACAFRLVALFADAPCRSVEAAYLKLLAMSQGYAKPRTLNLDGIFGLLPNLAWSGNTPYELDWLRVNRIALQMAGQYPAIDFVDKFPRFLHHIVPGEKTRLLDGAKIRLGAYIADGTTMMPGASYINFNAGTLGTAMIEGRVSSSVIIGEGSQVGDGASIIGVLSGGGKGPVTIGAHSLLGANSVCGIPLGDGCVIDAGIAVLAGSKISIAVEEQGKIGTVNHAPLPAGRTLFKGIDLAGLNGLHFRTDSQTGALTAFRSQHEVKLNKALHG